MEKKLIKKVIYTGEITLITGLHIGGSNTAMNIGGPDKFVVRNPISNLPYIPGSSLKGKIACSSRTREWRNRVWEAIHFFKE